LIVIVEVLSMAMIAFRLSVESLLRHGGRIA
jgi:hypothetical protein